MAEGGGFVGGMDCYKPPLFVYLSLLSFSIASFSIASFRARATLLSLPCSFMAISSGVLSFALAWAEVLQAEDIFIGVNALDYSGYPDCRPEYIDSYQHLANLATKAGVEGSQRLKIHAPLMEMTKARIISTGIELGVDYALTHSCYDPDSSGISCGQCDSCVLRLRGFSDAGTTDPVKYQDT